MNQENINKTSQNVIKLAIRRAKELDINKIVVASCSGKTALMLVNSGLEIICITHQIGFSQSNQDEMSSEMRKELKKSGFKILTTTHLLGGVDRALRLKFKGVYPSEIVSTTLRMLGQGIKVCVEISVMAADAGLIKAGDDIIAIGGTGKGADTAIVINPSHSQNFFDTRICEIIYKPYFF